ncbi:MFS transporter [Azotosporobacter soli]|uniref:MFS transporter n=1 Tax=Azotosporobacter soli TaxID=3055040 RepID=UPI0031FE5CB0
MQRQRMLLIFTAIAVLITVVVLGFSGWLNILSFKKNHVDSLVAGYAVAGGETRREIEYALRYGKPVTNFYGMQELLGKTAAYAPGLENIRLALPDGRVLYGMQVEDTGLRLPPAVVAKLDFQQERAARDYAYVLQEKDYHLLLPVRDRQENWVAVLDMSFAAADVDAEAERQMGPIIRSMLLIAAAAAFCLGALLWLVPLWAADGSFRRKRILFLFIAVLGAAQLSYAAASTSTFKTAYLAIAQKNTLLSAAIIQQDVDRVIGMGVPYQRLRGVDEWLQRIVRSVPELETIYLSDAQGQLLHGSAAAAPSGEAAFQYSMPLRPDRSGVEAQLHVVLSKAYVEDKVKNILLDALTVSLISFFFMVEVVLFVLRLLKLKMDDSETESGGAADPNMIRSLAFLFFLATDMSISFIPMQMKNLLQPLWGLSKQTLIALPISAEMLCASLTAISTGFIIDKRGWRFPFFVGAAVLFVGVLLSGLARSGEVFILARALVGTGFGFAWMAMRGYVAASPAAAARAKGFAQMNAGIYAGNICACAFGALLAERLGYSGVFFVALGVVAMTAVFALWLVKDPDKADVGKQAVAVPGKTTRRWRAFFGDAGVVGVMLFITIPSALCLTGFLNYFFPLYSNQMGLSPANIGRAFMIYGICIVYLGPVMGKIIARSNNIARLIIVGSCVGVSALLIFSWQGAMAAAIAAVALFGIADSIGFIAQNTFLLTLPATKAFGEGKALGFFSMTKKLGQMLGPVVFAWSAGLGQAAGIGWIGVAYFGAVLVFLLLIKENFRKNSFSENQSR